jgi:hypothetical protein
MLKLPYRPGDKVLFQPLLFQVPQDFRFVRKTLSTGPASRLIIAVKAENDGKDHWALLFACGESAVLGMNTFVDCSEGYLSLSHSFSPADYCLVTTTKVTEKLLKVIRTLYLRELSQSPSSES